MDNFLSINKQFNKFKIRRTFKEAIEPEEILLDAAKAPDLEEQRIEVAIKPKIFRIFSGIIFLFFLILAARAAYMQVGLKNYYSSLAERNRIRSYPIYSSRGIIYDKDFKQLVFNVPNFNLLVSLPDLPRDEHGREAVIKKAADVSGLDEEIILEKIGGINLKTGSSAVVVESLDHSRLLELQAVIDALPGFRIEQNIARQYVNALAYSHILGYMGKLTEQEAEKNLDYSLTEKIGKNGLEAFYEDVLRGRPGRLLMEVDSLGRLQGTASEQKSEDGRGLVLTIDGRLQSALYNSLGSVLKKLRLKKAAAVALDPKTGGVLAMVSFPTFDSNLFARGISADEYNKLSQDPDKPLFNRAIAGQYPPGSTVKPLIGAAALQEEVVSPRTKIFSAGEITLVNQYNPDIIYRFADWKAHGLVDIYSAIAQSCDVYFYTVGGGYDNIQGLGMDRLEKYFKLFGLGGILGLDLPGENKGLVPNEQWKQDVKGEDWYTGDTYHVSIGQGDLLTTPLQMAAASAAIINGGKVMTPRLVDKIIDSDKNIINQMEPKVSRQGFINEENLAIIKKAMRQTVTDGSARLLNDLPVAVGAKTGTAQVAGDNNPNAWGVVFAPYENPEMVLVVLAENAGEGSHVAMPVIKETLREYYNRQ